MLALMIPMIAGAQFIPVIIELAFFCVIAWVVSLGFTRLKPAEPFATIILIVLIVIGLVVLWEIISPLVHGLGGGGSSC